jgi:hypothetical protein
MTREEKIKKLSDEQLRIKVAELCGFTDIFCEDIPSECDSRYRSRRLVGLPRHDGPGGPYSLGWHPIPDYPNDLNAIHDAEMILTEEQFSDYVMALFKMFYITNPNKDFLPDRTVMCATARQRSEALVLTMEK